MFITTTQAGGLGRYHSGSIFFYIRIPDLYSYETINQFTARLCKKIYRIYFRILNCCERNHCINNKFKYIIISVHNKPVYNYFAIYIFLPQKILILPPYMKFDYIRIMMRDFLKALCKYCY